MLRGAKFGKQIKVVTGHQGPVRCVVLDEERSLVYTGSNDYTIQIHRVEGSGRHPFATLRGHDGWVTALALDRTNNLLYSGSTDSTIRVWNAKSRECTHVLTGHRLVVYRLKLSGDKLYSCSEDGDVRVWGKNFQCSQIFRGHGGWVKELSVSDRGLLVSCCQDAPTSFIAWNMSDMDACKSFQHHKDVVSSVFFHENLLFTGSHDGFARAFEVPDASVCNVCSMVSHFHYWKLSRIDVDAGNLQVCPRCFSEKLFLGRNTANTETPQLEEDVTEAFSPASTDGETLDEERPLESMYQFEEVERSLKHLKSYPGHFGAVSALQVCCKDGETVLVTGSYDSNIRVWNMNGSLEDTWKGHTQGITHLHSGGLVMFSASSDCSVRVWRISNGVCMHILQQHVGGLHDMCVGDDVLAVASEDSTCSLWAIPSDTSIRQFVGHTKIVKQLELLPADSDAPLLLSISHDKTAKLWTTKSGVCLHTLTHRDYIVTCCVSVEHALIALGSDDHTASVWKYDSTGSCSQVCLVVGHGDAVTAVEFVGDQLLTSSADGLMMRWSTKKLIYPKTDTSPSPLRDKWLELQRLIPRKAGKEQYDVPLAHCLAKYRGHTDGITSMAVWADEDDSERRADTLAFTGANDGSLYRWDQLTQAGGTERFTHYEGHEGAISKIKFHALVVYSASEDFTVRMWKLDEPKCLRVFQGHVDMVHDFVVKDDENLLISCGGDRTIRTFDLKSGHQQRVLRHHDRSVTSLKQINGYVVSVANDGTTYVWSKGQHLAFSLDSLERRVTALGVDSNSGHVYTAYSSGAIRMWKVSSG